MKALLVPLLASLGALVAVASPAPAGAATAPFTAMVVCANSGDISVANRDQGSYSFCVQPPDGPGQPG